MHAMPCKHSHPPLRNQDAIKAQIHDKQVGFSITHGWQALLLLHNTPCLDYLGEGEKKDPPPPATLKPQNTPTTQKHNHPTSTNFKIKKKQQTPRKKKTSTGTGGGVGAVAGPAPERALHPAAPDAAGQGIIGGIGVCVWGDGEGGCM